MGRRKIEIKAIKDDRNRSVTFLKRKGGLFKKAHELSVLCSVDVAVIIFGHNKKLYEFSSGDINETIGRYQYYGGAHEHKGPEDFMGKKDMDDDDEEDENMEEPAQGSHSPPEHAMMPHHHLQTQPQFQHIRQTTPSASPPMPNGAIPYHHRHASPQAPGISRPNSRQQIQRTGSNLAPPHHQSQPQPPQNIYAYTPNPPFYNPQAAQPMPPKPPGPHPPQYQYTHPPPNMAPNPQVQQFIQDQRRQSMPPSFPQERPQPQPQMPPMPSPPQPQQQQQQQPQPQHQQQQQQQQQPPPPPPQQQPPPPQQQQQQQQQEQQFSSPPIPQPKPLPASAKNHSIFTPIDDSRSMLAQHWGHDTTTEPAIKIEAHAKLENPRSQSIDVGAMSRAQLPVNGASPPKPVAQQLPKQPQRTASTSSLPSIAPPSRQNSLMGGARPRLKVQIPSGGSDNGSATGESSPRDTGTTGATPAKASTDASHSSGVVLPPPSPSASALLSAGATGPPNPFARPPPPQNNGSFGSNRDMETPISALPSRFMEGNLLPSPSSFYPDWGFGRESNMLPSPLTFQTPVVTNGPGFRDEDERKRKTSDGSEGATVKRIKT